jgi:hypothetical protein
MKKRGICTILAVALWVSTGQARDLRSKMWLIGGVQYGGILGSGDAGNTFDKGIGYHADYGIEFRSRWGWVIYGLSGYGTQNRVKDSKVKGSVFVPYFTEIRKSTPHVKFDHFFGVGFALSRLHIDKTKGSDNHMLITFGAGIQKFLPHKTGRGETVLEAVVRPYLITSNSLGQNWGFETRVSIGIGRRFR